MKLSNIIAEVKINYSPKTKNRIKITKSEDAYSCFKGIWNDQISYKESFYILLLNRANIVLGYHLLSVGGSVGTVVDIRILMQLLLKSNAHGFIVAHNHPSGNLTPSKEDLKLTQKIKEASKLLDIQLLDHLIVVDGEESYSMADNGLL